MYAYHLLHDHKKCVTHLFHCTRVVALDTIVSQVLASIVTFKTYVLKYIYTINLSGIGSLFQMGLKEIQTHMP